jgi:hypothetical protein
MIKQINFKVGSTVSSGAGTTAHKIVFTLSLDLIICMHAAGGSRRPPTYGEGRRQPLKAQNLSRCDFETVGGRSLCQRPSTSVVRTSLKVGG